MKGQQDQQTLFVKEQIENHLGFVGHTVLIATPQLCCKQLKGELNGQLCVSRNFTYENKMQVKSGLQDPVVDFTCFTT